MSRLQARVAGKHWWLAAVCGALLVGLMGCGSSSTPTPDPAAKYKQTWTRDYGKTTCRQWLNVMGPKQRFVAAADMLTTGRNETDGGKGVPSDRLINKFKAGLDDGCSVDGSVHLSDVGSLLYLTERSTYRP